MNKLWFILYLVSILLFSCKKNDAPGKVQFRFSHLVDGSALLKDNMNYANAAGNTYEVDELQYFISEVQLLREDGKKVTILADSCIHYVDIDIPSTLIWSPNQLIPTGKYQSVSFTFGIAADRNKSGLFVNPPERDMFWPEMMGGGYHYMKMNGKWKTPTGTINVFNFHIGVGMDSITKVSIPNNFVVNLANSSFEIADNQTAVINIAMNIEKWFIAPYVWNWDIIGGAIMQNQQAMKWACENGDYVFSVVK